MKRSFFRLAAVLALAASFLGLGGCAATSMALQHKDLSVDSTLMSDMVLPMTSAKTVAVAVRNSTTTPLNTSLMAQEISARLQEKGYTVVAPEAAHFQVTLSIYRSSLDKDFAANHGNGSGGALAGAIVGGSGGNGQGALVGALVGGIADTIAGSLVKDVNVQLTSEILVSVRQAAKVQTEQTATVSNGSSAATIQKIASASDFVTYRSVIVTGADQVNMKIADAIPKIQSSLVQVVSGIF
jgi:uncharacterized protein YcfJ